jgi:hypothetical protein
MAISVASQVASAAHTSHPGEGADALPPTPFGMSLTIVAPPGPSARNLRPPSQTVLAAVSV